MPIQDVNRIFPGEHYDELTDTNTQDVLDRLVRIEMALDRKLDQWNAPSLLQSVTGDEYKVQFGKFIYVHTGGSVSNAVTLPTAWTNEHTIFQITFRPLSSWDASFQLNGCGQGGLSIGSWAFTASTIQNYEANWFSIGK